MSQCLRCSGPCDATVVFCDECRSSLRTSFRQGSAIRAFSEDQVLIEQQRTATQSIVKAPDTPHPPVLESYPDSAAQAFSRLNEAARRIAHEDAVPGRRLPHAPRLTPFRDISAEIRRESTPLPNYAKMRTSSNSQERAISAADQVEQGASGWNENAGQPGKSGQGIQDAAWPDFWPWFDNEIDEKEGEDSWANRTDPLITRHRPNSVEAAAIEQEDMRRALAEGISTGQIPVRLPPRRKSPLRNIFIALAIFAVVALAIDGVLLGALSGRSHIPTVTQSGSSAASLILMPNVVTFNKTTTQATVQVQLSNFTANGQVLLTHDIQGDVRTTGGSGIVRMNARGSAIATIVVTSDWGSGNKQIFAEDVATRVTASAALQVIGAAPSQPAHLELPAALLKNGLDLGTGIQGFNTFKPIQLKNSSLSGSITWSASSDQPWLLISPNAGMFNQGQTINVAAQRSGKPGSYAGTIKFFSNVGTPEVIKVTMHIIPLPKNSPVLALSPAVLTFVTTDGSSAPPSQILTISNPGSQPLSWSLTATSSTTASTQIAISHQLGASGSWLSASPTSGTIPAFSNEQVYVSVQSADLLPSAFLGSLNFTAVGTNGQPVAGSPQTINVSLTVQPHCGLVTTPGFLSFTAVQGKASAGSQALGLNATASCSGSPINWTAQVSTPSWLSVSSTSVPLVGTASETLAVSVNPTGLAPQAQPYLGFLVFTALTTPKSTQTVLVQLTVQPQPTAGAPVMGASPLNLNFSSTSGQPNPRGQVVTITNNGGSMLYWSASAQQITTCWLCVNPSGGTIQPGQTGTVTVNVDTSKLSPGTYAGQVILKGTDSNNNPASGSPQTIAVNLVVQPPCTLTQPSLSSLAFTGVQGGTNPEVQPVLITGSGNCAWPLQISASVSSGASWLPSNYTSSIKGNGQSTSLEIGPNNINTYDSLTAGTYTAQVTITAIDSAGVQAQGSGQTITIMLTVEPPCTFAPPSPSSLTFSVDQGATSGTPKNVQLSETGTCARPITYTVSTKSAWLTLTQPLPDNGNGSSLSVNVNATGLAAGTYSGEITITAVDTNNVPVLATTNPVTYALTIKVTLTVIAYSVSGTVFACTGLPPVCLTPAPLPGATVTVLNGTTTVATVTADASGNYTIPALAPGNYTVNVSGTNQGTQYSGSQALSVTGNATGVSLYAY